MGVFNTIFLVGVSVVLIEGEPRHEIRKFPDGFIFGTSTASYQIEGAWNADGKSESIWDHFTHNRPDAIEDLSNGDIAANSYYLYKRDVEMLRELGVDFYRFSVSWPRILPNGFPDKINEAGVQYYSNLIDELLKYNIQPMLTIFHWDLPQKLQELGGWTNPDIVTWYTDYARIIYDLFGDRVKYFITINEPHMICYYAHGSDPSFAPGLDMGGVADYMCAKNVLLAHAEAYHVYDKEFRVKQNGTIFISYSAHWYEPATDSEVDIEAAKLAIQFHWALYTWPVYSDTGDFPPEMKEAIAKKSAEQGYPRSRLPELSPEEVELIKGTSDLFGLNHYLTYYTYKNASVPMYKVPSADDDLGVGTFTLPEWYIGDKNSFGYVPWGLRKLLNHIKDDYNNPPIFITENGFGRLPGLIDDNRVQFYRGYLGAVLDALDDGCNIRGYTAWSLIDSFEWSSGYTLGFGLYEVDYSDIYRTRTPRKSAYVYKELLRTRELDQHYEPDMSKPITIDEGH